MKNKINKFLFFPLLILSCSLLFIQCDEDETVVLQDNLDATLAKDADLSVFKAAIAQAKLETFTKGPRPFTLLAPTDAAFNAAGITAATLAGI